MPLRTWRILGLAAATVLFASAGARADAVSFVDFSAPGAFNLRGSAQTVSGNGGTVLRLTQANVFGTNGSGQAGSAFLANQFTLGSGGTFSAQFQFQITPGENAPADGFTFVLAQLANDNSPLEPGGNLGYHDLTNSVAVQFHLYYAYAGTGGSSVLDGGTVDNNDNEVGIDYSGLLYNAGAASPYGVGDGPNQIWACNSTTANPFGCMANSDIWTANLAYVNGALSVSVQDGSAPPSLVINNYALDIPDLIGTTMPYIGFTGGTGWGTSQQDILNVQIASDDRYAPVPEPASFAVLATGLAGLIFWRRRRRRQG